ncbi:Trp biosynthesis-associated membrane protein [Gulosibacter chungangensis]|uniref:Trp biosynthesis-associated membrane protein n=1 Tax=Gulosibacter chungangensis TaxID=979746 RepID=A0A7J5BD19_9MICO|nr:Trp biosynthesis-associated membrane protein [Gulosibacter chungangensis]KAB1644090.1 Trp biosynthesis-associated membrane protein [Gulosibacter chungangensis]
MSPKRLKQLAILAILLAAGLAMLTLTQPWAALGLHTQEFERDFTHSGGDAGTAIMGFGIAALAAAGALAIAGRFFRYVIGTLTFVLGVGITVAASIGIGDPAAGFGAEVRQFSGITDDAGVREIIAQGAISTSAWPLVALIAGILLSLAAVWTIITAHRWPQGSRKFNRTRFESVSEHPEIEENDRISQWDALSAGDDPTDSDNENTIRR